MVMFFWGARLYFIQSRAPNGAMEIHCVGRQWMWKFQHPEGHSEINDLHVPLGQPVKLMMISEDVIHSMYIPAFRVKQDVLPGRYMSVWFQPTKVGQYHLFCAEYCGAKHSEMIGTVHVLEPSQYQAWLAGHEPAGHLAQLDGGPAAGVGGAGEGGNGEGRQEGDAAHGSHTSATPAAVPGFPTSERRGAP